jgi:hypothetical protein
MPVTVVRMSDGEQRTYDEFGPKTWVKSLKSALRKDLLPKVYHIIECIIRIIYLYNNF